jgi:hypothetical protein
MTNKKKESIFGSEKISNWYKKRNKAEMTLIWIFTGAIVLTLSLSMLISTVRTYDSDLSLQECNQLRIDDVRYALQIQEENSIFAFIYAFQFPFKLLVGAIAIGWILHGVGFTVIGR